MLAQLRVSNLSIRTRIILIVSGTLVVGLLVLALLMRDLIGRAILTQKITTAEILTTSVLNDLTYTASEDRQLSAQQILAKYMTYYRIIRAMTIYDADLIGTASSDSARVGRQTGDPDVVQAITRAKPSLHVSRPDARNLDIRSVAPILQGSRIRGAVALDMSIRDLQQILGDNDRHVAMLTSIVLVLVAAALFVLLRMTILRRLHRLIQVTREITVGNYAIAVADTQGDEIGRLGRAFDQMTTDLQKSKREIEHYNRHLEDRVHEATAQLQKAYEDLKNAQSQLILNEKMAS